MAAGMKFSEPGVLGAGRAPWVNWAREVSRYFEFVVSLKNNAGFGCWPFLFLAPFGSECSSRSNRIAQSWLVCLFLVLGTILQAINPCLRFGLVVNDSSGLRQGLLRHSRRRGNLGVNGKLPHHKPLLPAPRTSCKSDVEGDGGNSNKNKIEVFQKYLSCIRRLHTKLVDPL